MDGLNRAVGYLVIATDGELLERDSSPTSRGIAREVGEPGWGMVHTAGATKGWVNDSGHLLSMPRNMVGSLLLASIGATPMPYAGTVVVTGWDDYQEIMPLRNPDQVDGLRAIVTDIRRLLGLDPSPLSDLAAERWQKAMRQLAEHVRTAPTPTMTVLVPGDAGWPL